MSLLSACDGQPIPKAIYELIKPQDDTPIQNTKGFNSDTIIVGDRVVVKIIGRKRRLPHDLQTRANIGRMIDSLHKGLRDISPDLVWKTISTGCHAFIYRLFSKGIYDTRQK